MPESASGAFARTGSMPPKISCMRTPSIVTRMTLRWFGAPAAAAPPATRNASTTQLRHAARLMSFTGIPLCLVDAADHEFVELVGPRIHPPVHDVDVEGGSAVYADLQQRVEVDAEVLVVA